MLEVAPRVRDGVVARALGIRLGLRALRASSPTPKVFPIEGLSPFKLFIRFGGGGECGDIEKGGVTISSTVIKSWKRPGQR